MTFADLQHISRKLITRVVQWNAARRGKRALVREILSLQIMITAVIGSLAVAALYWGGQWVLQDNYSRWALQWTEELNELGAPLYLTNDNDALLRLESFIDKYSEIERVIYYKNDGTVLFSISNTDEEREPASDLTAAMLQNASERAGGKQPYVMKSSLINARAFKILAPVWTESITSDGLFDFDPELAAESSAIDLIGFVGLELDFMLFHDRLLKNIKIAISVLLLVLIASGIIGRATLRKALSSISDLQEPISELAKGNLRVQFKPAEHREISEIVEALESTATALGERDARLLQLANHDVLTGLFNRRRFVDELKKEIDNVNANDKVAALMFVDLDQFKYVNDTCGHPAGDRMLRKVADQLIRSIGDHGQVARFGGDEFAILVPDTSKPAVTALAEAVLDDMRRLAHIESDNVFHVHCSIGITMIDSSRFDHDDLIAQVDIACREAKASGRNRLQFFSMSEREAEKMVADVGWMSKLRSAIDNNAFVLRYQPIVSIATGETTHHEVLLRMRDEDGKLVGPDAFLPAAMRFGLMAEIDTWMIENAVAAIAEYRVEQPELCFAINLSVNAFESENLATFVRTQLTRHGVPAQSIVFEITESLAVRHLKHVEQQISALRAIGCQLALDDFGTGYSSFSHLKRLSVDYIKIDGCFVRELEESPVDQKMVRMIAEIAREAGMRTIAEYVQSHAALKLLGELGVEYAQGYYVGRPTAVPTRRSMPVSLAVQRLTPRAVPG
ncbi:MAG TPA: EAL domain-containing protein [Woeseiaceae bacterium]|nr:EAL domain-containing protein [Woeseiaceae bacterium]